MNSDKTLKILQVVAQLERGGAETWLMNVLRNIDREAFKFDFMVHTPRNASYNEEIRGLGCRIFPVPRRYRMFAYSDAIRNIIRRYGPYDVLHCHLFCHAGHILRIAYQENIRKRIVHCHNSCRLSEYQSLIGAVYSQLTHPWTKRYATMGLFCSELAAISKLGANWQQDPRWVIFPCGLNLSPFEQTVDTKIVRGEFGLPSDSFVIGHVGNFYDVKNHSFLVKIAAELVKADSQVYFLLVGDGSLKAQIQKEVARAGIENRVIFAGLRADVPRLMLGAMDLFLLPSLTEGLGLVLIEAQAAGLSCVCSDVVPHEAAIIKPLVTRLSLSLPPRAWAQKIADVKNHRPKIDQPLLLEVIKKSSFNIEKQVGELKKIYLSD